MTLRQVGIGVTLDARVPEVLRHDPKPDQAQPAVGVWMTMRQQLEYMRDQRRLRRMHVKTW